MDRPGAHGLVAALLGAWARGKAMLLADLREGIARSADTHVITLSPWTCGPDASLSASADTGALVRCLSETLVPVLDEKGNPLRDALDRYAAVL